MTLDNKVGWLKSVSTGLANFAFLFAMHFASTKWQGALLAAADLLLVFATFRLIDHWARRSRQGVRTSDVSRPLNPAVPSARSRNA